MNIIFEDFLLEDFSLEDFSLEDFIQEDFIQEDFPLEVFFLEVAQKLEDCLVNWLNAGIGVWDSRWHYRWDSR